MPVDKQVLLRYQVLNECFRNKYRDYTIDDLVDECSKAMREKLDIMDGVSKRTIQNDIANLEMPPYNIRLDENLKSGRKRLFRYLNTDDTLHLFRMNDEERHKVQDAIRVLNDYEDEPLYDWARMFLMQVEGGMFDEDTSSIVSFQSNPDLKGLSHFGKLLQAIISKRVLKMRYAVNLPFLRWNRYKLAMNDVSAAINQKKGCTKTNPQRTDDTLYFEIFDF